MVAVSRPSSRRPIVLLVAGALIGAAVAAAGLGTAGRRAGLPAGAVALVNGIVIREDDYARMVQAMADDTRAPLTADDRRHVLDRLIDEELLVQRGLALGLPRSDRRVRADLTSTVIDGVVSDASERQPTDAELAAFYDANRAFFTGAGRVRVRQVFVRVTSLEDAAAKRRAEDAARRLRAGEPFEDVAADGDAPVVPLPDAPLSAAKLREYLGPTALRAALELAAGQVSDPVRSGSGYHVLQMLERQPDAAPPLADVRMQVEAEFRRRAGESALRAYLDELRANAIVVTAEPRP
jgi:hypothetical protein